MNSAGRSLVKTLFFSTAIATFRSTASIVRRGVSVFKSRLQYAELRIRVLEEPLRSYATHSDRMKAERAK